MGQMDGNLLKGVGLPSTYQTCSFLDHINQIYLRKQLHERRLMFETCRWTKRHSRSHRQPASTPATLNSARPILRALCSRAMTSPGGRRCSAWASKVGGGLGDAGPGYRIRVPFPKGSRCWFLNLYSFSNRHTLLSLFFQPCHAASTCFMLEYYLLFSSLPVLYSCELYSPHTAAAPHDICHAPGPNTRSRNKCRACVQTASSN